MKFTVKNFNGNLTDLMRSAGYHFDGADQKTKELKFYRSLSGGLFPRFHIYLQQDRSKAELFISLHIDQKAPVYQGVAAHGGDYEGEVVEKEGEHLRSILTPANPDLQSSFDDF